MAASHITEFLQSLSSEEIKVVREYISRSNNRLVLGENKIEKLFDILIKEPNREFNYKDLTKILKTSEATLRVLKSRLFEKIEEALVMKNHLKNKLIFNHRERLVFVLKKKILLIKSLNRNQNQKRIATINLLINETITLAKKNQIYDVLIETLYLQRNLNGIRLGIKEFERLSKELSYYESVQKSVQNAHSSFYKVILNNNFINSFNPSEFDLFISNSITQMEIDYKSTKAQEIFYYIYFLKIAQTERKKNYNQAILYCKKLLLLLKKSPIVYLKERVGFVMANLVQFNVFVGKFRNAVSIAKRAENFLAPNSFNYITLKEQEALAFFYSKDYSNSHNCFRILLQHASSDTRIFHISRFNCYIAYTLFALGKFKEALHLINIPLEIEKDKAGWNISVRILLIKLYVELNKISEAQTSISSLRKHLERTKKIKEIKGRDYLIVKLLIELEKDGFKRNKKNKTTTKLLKTLTDKDKPTSWNYFTPELIPFHEWVMTRPVKTIQPKLQH